MQKWILRGFAILAVIGVLAVLPLRLVEAQEEDRATLDQEVDATIALLKSELEQSGSKKDNGSAPLQKALGYLVFPDVRRTGLLFGASFGTGKLVLNEGDAEAETLAPDEYYRIRSRSFGLQFGVSRSKQVLAIMNEDELNRIRKASRSDKYKPGSDTASVNAQMVLGSGVDTFSRSGKDVIVYSFSPEGLMLAPLSFDGRSAIFKL